jgi:thiol-disulfide isomerase/thioredoxin
MAKKKEELEEIEELEVVKSSDDEEEEEFVELTTEERIVSIEKKVNIILAIVIATLAISLISLVVVMNNGTGSNNNKADTQEKTEEAEATYDISAFKEIRAQDIAAESKNETIVVMIGRQGCGYCAMYAPIITEVANNLGITVRYIDFLKIVNLEQRVVTDEEAYNTIKNLSATKEFEGAGEDALGGTPKTLVIKNNKIINYISGAADADTLTQQLKASGLGN